MQLAIFMLWKLALEILEILGHTMHSCVKETYIYNSSQELFFVSGKV